MMLRAASCFSGIGAPELGMPQYDWVWHAEIEPFPAAVLAARLGAGRPVFMPDPAATWFPDGWDEARATALRGRSDEIDVERDEEDALAWNRLLLEEQQALRALIEVAKRRAAIKALDQITWGNRSPNFGDVLHPEFLDRAVAMGPLDLLAGGPPCQAFSTAGLRGSMADPRGNLTLRWVQIIHAVRPRNAVTENVPGWLNTPDNAFGCFLAGLVGADAPLCSPLERGRWPDAGMVAGPRARAAWRVLDAQYFGLAQRRERVFVVADLGGGADPAEILFERQGLLGNHPPRREAGEGVACPLAKGSDGGSGYRNDQDTVENLVAGTITAAMRRRAGQPNDDNPADYLVAGHYADGSDGTVSSKWAKGTGGPAGDETYNLVAHSLRAEGFDASEDGTGRGTPLVPVPVDLTNCSVGYGVSGTLEHAQHKTNRGQGVAYAIHSDALDRSGEGADGTAAARSGLGVQKGCAYALKAKRPDAIAFSCKDYGNDASEDLAPTLRSMGHAESHPNGGGQMAVAFVQNSRSEVRQVGGDGQITGAIASNAGAQQQHYVAQPVAYSITPSNSNRDYNARETERAQAVNTNGGRPSARGGDFVAQDWQVRRLTPTECHRLQGFPDDWCFIEYRGKPAADGPIYKALGNSWAVKVGAWIGRRLAAAQMALRNAA